ncbi:hypothetical protein DIU36_02280 [Mucilaginibacter rubeus]|nr:hypothetical protein DIU36_02280 [Mucilaginibacter rubeus]
MGNSKYNNANVLLLLVAYLFVVLTHILFLPPHGQRSLNPQGHYNSIFKRKLDNANNHALSLMHRTDKSVLNKNQNIHHLFIKLAGSFFILLLLARIGRRAKLLTLVPFRRYFYPYPPFRLSLRI